MKIRRKFIIGLLYLVLCACPVLLYAQERVDARLEARQHYIKGKEYYAQGLYEEATAEFDRAIEILNKPQRVFLDNIQKEANRAIAPAAPAPVPTHKTELKTEPEPVIEAAAEEVVSVPAIPPQTTPSLEEQIQPAEKASPTAEKEYYLDIGDTLDISVWQVPDLSRDEVIVRPDGRISFPLIGDLKAKGLTLTQLDEAITEKLKTYVKSPEVSVMIRRFGAKAEGKGVKNKIVILGEILSPGVYEFEDVPTITEVLASAGGYTRYAVLNSIMVIRGDIKTKPELMRLNVADVLKTGNLSQNIDLKANDIVYVPRSFIGKLNVFLELIQPALNEYMQTLNARQLQHTVHSKSGI
jgi:polysaccharide export outer membrane protein